jgi:hypothetical protein
MKGPKRKETTHGVDNGEKSKGPSTKGGGIEDTSKGPSNKESKKKGDNGGDGAITRAR